jgi:two-component system, cell cycle sensor histidine kinase and response regulator CckA
MIVVVDDEAESLALLTSVLVAEGYSVRPITSGEQAVASILASPPELILLDIRMPSMDGFDVCRELKARKLTRNIPVIFLSAASEVQDRVEGLRMGGVDFISKPFHRDELLARVRIHLELARLRSHLEQQVVQRTTELTAANDLLCAELAERRRTEAALRESEERFRNLADRAPVGIWVMGRNMHLLFHNKRALTFIGGGSAHLGGSWTSIIHPDDLGGVQSKYRAALKAHRGFRIECRMRRASGKYRWVLHTGIPRFINGEFAGHIGTSVDFTDFKRSHERMRAAEKLESLGALTAGIAHDFNNLVGSIFAASDLALSDLPPESPARENIERINAVATRASQVINLLLTYAGAGDSRRDRIDLSLVVAEMLALLKDTITPKAELQADLTPNLPEIRASVTEIRQVVLNLIMNASESLQQHEGTIRVTTDCVSASHVSPIEPGRTPEIAYCRLIVSDTGTGMPPEVRARAFDPFYTTKCLGRGLGLAVVHGIIRSLGGAVNIVSTPGEGSSFEVLVPCSASRGVENPQTGKPPRHDCAFFEAAL